MASALWYTEGVRGMFTATAARQIDWVNDTIIVSLHTSSYTPSQATHVFLSSATNEVSGNNYSRQTLTGKTINLDIATFTVQLRATSTTFTNLGSPSAVAFRWILVWKDTGVAGTSPLLGYVDAGTQSVLTTNFVITWNASDGVLKGVTS